MALSLAFLALCIAALPIAIPVYAEMEAEIALRPGGFFQAVLALRFEPRLLAAHVAVALAALYSLTALAFIYFFFEKTQSPEILFVAFFAASLSPEALRLALPLARAYDAPALHLLMASRAILFGRYFGLFSLFAASVHAAGYQAQQQRNAILIIVATTTFVALGMPVDTQVWDSSLAMLSGYASMFRLVEAGLFLLTAASFFIAARARGSREFVLVGAGAVLALAGRAVLLRADTWAALPIGLPLLAFGTWLVCTRLHRVYLWL